MTGDRLRAVSRATAPTPDTLMPAADPETAYRLIASAVRQAVESLGPIEVGVHDAADGFRWQPPAEANQRFLTVIESLRLLASVADMAAAAAGLDLTELCGPGGVLDELGRALDQLTAQQFAEDWVSVAVTLDEQLAPALGAWREVLTAILLQADFRFRARRVH